MNVKKIPGEKAEQPCVELKAKYRAIVLPDPCTSCGQGDPRVSRTDISQPTVVELTEIYEPKCVLSAHAIRMLSSTSLKCLQ
jgi:hypothetical protein